MSIPSDSENNWNFYEIAKSVFDANDSHHSGHINEKQLKAALVKVGETNGIERIRGKQLVNVLIALNTDGTGDFQFEEFKALAEELLDSNCDE